MGFFGCCSHVEDEDDDESGSQSSKGKGQAPDHQAIEFKKGNVTALSKDWKGTDYTLGQDQFESLCESYQVAYEYVKATIGFLNEIQKGPFEPAGLMTMTAMGIPNPSPLGNLAYHFNLIDVTDEKSVQSVKTPDLENLVRIVRQVFELVRDGLEGPMLFGGVPTKLGETLAAEKASGYVSKKPADFFPEERKVQKVASELGASASFEHPKVRDALTKIPPLEKDQIFVVRGKR